MSHITMTELSLSNDGPYSASLYKPWGAIVLVASAYLAAGALVLFLAYIFEKNLEWIAVPFGVFFLAFLAIFGRRK